MELHEPARLRAAMETFYETTVGAGSSGLADAELARAVVGLVSPIAEARAPLPFGPPTDADRVADFRVHLESCGYNARTVAKRCALAVKALEFAGIWRLAQAAGVGGDEDPSNPCPGPAWEDFVVTLPDWERKNLQPMLTAWRNHALDAGASCESFGFRLVEGTSQTMAGAALLNSGHPAGDGSCNVLFCDLPFSAFLDCENVDPAVSEALGRAKEAIRLAGDGLAAMLFRVEWSVGSAVGGEAAYRDLVAALLPGFEVRTAVVDNAHCVAMEGEELFVAAARRWRGEFRGVAKGGRPRPLSSHLADATPSGTVPALAVRVTDGFLRDPAAANVPCEGGTRRPTPCELASVFGVDPSGLPSDTPAAYRALGRTVPLNTAERAVHGLNGAAELS